jgi:prephenate dehydrogenase
MITLPPLRITIAGLGLMGGSLALALRPYTPHLTAVDPDPTTRQTALSQGLVDAATDNLAEGIKAADLLILAAPVRAILAQLAELPGCKPDGCLLLDLGSTKQAICQAMSALPPSFQAIGGHPMCGRETSGLSAATADLYHTKTFILCPTARTTPAVEQIALELVTAIGSRPLWLDPAEHDQMVAAVSHLPYLLSAAFMQQAAALARIDQRLWPVSASGFRDTARLAGSNPAVMLDILLTNRAAVLSQLEQYQQKLAMIAALLQAGDETAARDWLEAAQADYNHYRQTSLENTTQ